MMPCPDDKTLKLFIVGNLAPQRIEEIEKHLETCPNCSQRLAKLEVGSGIPLFQGIKAAQFSGSGSMAGDHSIDGVIPQTIGHYKVCDLLGAGGMGTVYLAENPHLDRQVAIKVVKASRRIHQASVDRFVREMKAAGKLQHPNIVQSHDGGVIGDTADGQPFLVMEYLEGSDLSEYVKDHGPFSVEKACDIIRQVASGLDYAHRLGFVHRDIKPSNLWITPEGTVKILDFGLVNILETETLEAQTTTPLHETALGSILGSPDYISPEQIVDSKKADSRSDIYSLGCTFFFLLTGRPPFDKATHPNLDAKLQAHAKQDLPPLRPFRNDVPIAVEAVLRRMTAKRPEDRYQNAEAVLKAIANLKPSRTKWIVGTVASVMLVLAGAYLFQYLFLPKFPDSVPIAKPSVEPTIPDVAVEEPQPKPPIAEEKSTEPSPEPLPDVIPIPVVAETDKDQPPQTAKDDISHKIITNTEIGNWFPDRTLSESLGDYGSALFTVDGRQIIDAQTNGGVQLWKMSGAKANRFNSTGAITAVARSPDGKWLAFAGIPQSVPPLRQSSGGSTLHLVSSPYNVQLYDLETGKQGFHIIPQTVTLGPITTLAFSNNSKRIFVGGSCGELWNVEYKERNQPSIKHPKIMSQGLKGRIVTSLFSSDDDKIYMGDDQKNLYCFAANSNLEPPPIGVLPLPDNVTCLKCFPEKTSIAVLTGSNAVDYVNFVKVWGKRPSPKMEMQKTGTWVHPNQKAKLYCIAFSPDNTRAALGGDGFLDIWNMKRGDIEESLKQDDPQDRIIALDFNSRGEVLLARTLNTGGIQLWNFIPYDAKPGMQNARVREYFESKKKEATERNAPTPPGRMPRGGYPGNPNPQGIRNNSDTTPNSQFSSPTRNRALVDRNP